MRKVFLSIGLSLLLFNVNAQVSNTAGDLIQIQKILNLYRDGPANGDSAASKVANEIITILNTNFKDKNKTAIKNDLTQITEVLSDYIEGTANGQPERLRKAFHQNFNLYTVAKDTLWIRSGAQYIANIKDGQKLNRIGRIVSIDVEKDAAMAKAEIVVPDSRTFTDYFLLLKYAGAWKIVHKSYSWQELPKAEKK